MLILINVMNVALIVKAPPVDFDPRNNARRKDISRQVYVDTVVQVIGNQLIG